MKQLHPRAFWLFFLSFLGRWFVMVIISDIFFFKYLPSEQWKNWQWYIIPLPIIFILCFVWAKLTYHFYRYELTDSGFRKESGVLYKRYTTIPYNRVQSVDIDRGILSRLLRLSNLQIITAGSSVVFGLYGKTVVGAEGRLSALSPEVAEQLRNEIIQRARQSANQEF